MYFTMIVGLPGSGKTTLASTFASQTVYKVIVIDDPKDFQTDVLDKVSALEQNPTILEIIISDPWFCLEDVRKRAESKLFETFKDIHINWIYFENDLEACKANIERRRTIGDIRHIGKQLDFFHKNYSIPPNATVRKCYAPHNFKIGDRVMLKSQNVCGTIIGYYSDVIMQVVFDDSVLGGAEFIDSMALVLVQEPNEALKELL